jgi:hypothetical protein
MLYGQSERRKWYRVGNQQMKFVRKRKNEPMQF